MVYGHRLDPNEELDFPNASIRIMGRISAGNLCEITDFFSTAATGSGHGILARWTWGERASSPNGKCLILNKVLERTLRTSNDSEAMAEMILPPSMLEDFER